MLGKLSWLTSCASLLEIFSLTTLQCVDCLELEGPNSRHSQKDPSNGNATTVKLGQVWCWSGILLARKDTVRVSFIQNHDQND